MSSKYTYKYIKGQEVYMQEHMLSATELAKLFGLYTPNNNPNGLLVSRILADFIRDSNLNVSDYYYPHSHGVMKVYPAIVYQKVLNDFVFDLEHGKEYSYVTHEKNGKGRINYKYFKRRSGNIISMTERRGTNGRK